MYDEAMTGVKKHLIAHSKPSELTYVGELPSGIGSSFSPKMDHLVCFLGGIFALGATRGHTVRDAKQNGFLVEGDDLSLGAELTRSCYEMYSQAPSKLAPEIVWFNMQSGSEKDFLIKPRDAHNLMRPETVESLFVLWRITKNPIYRSEVLIGGLFADTRVDRTAGRFFLHLKSGLVLTPDIRLLTT